MLCLLLILLLNLLSVHYTILYNTILQYQLINVNRIISSQYAQEVNTTSVELSCQQEIFAVTKEVY